MTSRAKVAVLRTEPETVLQDYERLLELADVGASLDPDATTILKDNISWHYPMPGANTTPWQLEGTILALRKAGFESAWGLKGGMNAWTQDGLPVVTGKKTKTKSKRRKKDGKKGGKKG